MSTRNSYSNLGYNKTMLYLKGNTDQKKLENWIDDLGLRNIRESDKVQRLRKVRFLGTMPYFVDLAVNYSRYDHSIYVAKLADAIGKQLNTSQEFRRLLVLAALLHDIGHLPFSHASEVYFRQTWGKYHTSHGARLTYHLVKFLKLNGQDDLAEAVDFANDLLQFRKHLNNEFEDGVFYEMFHGSLSADTMDGIMRASESVGLDFDDPSKLISGFVREKNKISILSTHLEYVYNFLRLKKNVYADYVYSARGMSAEAMLTRCLELAFKDDTGKNDFISLDDESIIEKIKYNAKAFQLFNDLESGKLFYSLGEYAPEKHKLVSDIYSNLSGDSDDPIIAKRSLEENLIKQLGASPEQVILHASIRLKFWDDITYQQELFSSPLSLKNISRKFTTQKVYGQSIDLFMAKNLLSRSAFLEIPSEIRLIQKGSTNRQVNALEQHAGAYMTPASVAQFIIKWAIKKNVDRILDPSSGEGIFIKEAHRRLIKLGLTPTKALKKIYGIEADNSRWQNSLSNWEHNVAPAASQIMNDNFFDCVERDQIGNFDVIFGNPPYINFHRFTGDRRDKAIEVTKRLTGISLSKRSSSWAPYLLCSLHLLKENGRLGMVLPHELLTTDYAEPVRIYLKGRFKSLIFVFFGKRIFDNQQGVLLLLASNDEPYGQYKVVTDAAASLNPSDLNNEATPIVESGWLEGKWTDILVSNQKILELIRKLTFRGEVVKLKDVAKVSIGLVTGKNAFFILSKNEIKMNNIDFKWTLPIINKASHMKGSLFVEEDLRSINDNNKECYLLHIPPSADINSELYLNKYLEEGKRQEVDQKYKCRMRWPWYSVPMQLAPPAFMTYMSGKQVRFVLNECGIYSTNSIHNVYFKSDITLEMQKALIASFYCTIAQISIELIGRSYGGGVLKLEIGEAENILLPNILNATSGIVKKLARYLNRIDKELRSGGITPECISALDDLILRDVLKLSQSTCKELRDEIEKLQKRRLS